MSGSGWNRIVAASPGKPLILLIAALIYVGILGTASVDIGLHWDEPKLVSSLQTAVESGWLVPRWYNYPSMSFDMALLVAAPHAASSALHASPSEKETGLARRELVDYLGGDEFKCQLRSVYFVLSCLTGLVIYHLARGLSGRDWVGVLAALVLLSSWEFTYHAKWIAPDCLLVLFASCSLLGQYGILTAENQGRRLLLVVVAAIFAGLAMGTKYPGGIVLMPLLLAIGLSAKRPNLKPPREIGLCLLAVFLEAGVFVITTPGCYLDPQGFSRDVHYEMAHYGRIGHAGYSVIPGWDHLSKMLVYLASVSLSENAVLAVAASVSAILGVACLARTKPRIVIWFLSLPLLYAAYMSSQRVMIVRNCLLLLPFLAISAALGVGVMVSATSRRPLRLALCGISIFFVLYNLGEVTRSSLSILYPNAKPMASAVAERVASAPRTKLYLSPACRELLTADFMEKQGNLVESPQAADKFIFLSDEVPGWRLYPANVPGRYRTVWSRMQEVNWDYYPSWTGSRRVLEVSASDPALETLRKRIASTGNSVDSG